MYRRETDRCPFCADNEGIRDAAGAKKRKPGISAGRSVQRILIVPPQGILSVLYTEPAIRVLGRQQANPVEITICHEHADLLAGHPAMHGLAFGDAGDLAQSFDKIVYLRGRPGKGNPMDWIFDAAHQLGVILDQQEPQIVLNSFDFVRTQRFGISKLSRPRAAIASVGEEHAGWTLGSRKKVCRILRDRMQAEIIYLGDNQGEIDNFGKDLRGKLTAREIAAVLKQCDLLIGDDSEIISLAAAVQVLAVYVCRKPWDSWTAEKGAMVVSVYPGKPAEILVAIGQLSSFGIKAEMKQPL